MVQRAATAALVALSVSSLIQQAVFAASERTTALVTIAEANARCLIETNQMKAVQAQDIANRFLTSKGVSDADREEVQSAPGYDDLMRRYIDEQGGCEDLVRQLR
ncbi:hypothetical protein KR52_05545 [Synechococcus sp. KORDI-52]|uniref:hypothetical protein n=1 Tax=Synechococcus sp. KORDI-52 TaxID=585425 RepID=UPI0004E09A62|nr:hypothetical protein [Synechococcus sp. KORDI-52]AII48606.1 hypothetical protein KR52_05545 [Synechococcus sp. KORDI-52]